MRIWVVFVLLCGILFLGFQYFKTIKFDTAVSVCVTKEPFKGVSLKLLDYKVSYNDLHVENEFWESKLGKALFQKLSLKLQAIIIAGKRYVDVRFNVNYLGLIHRHYQVIEVDGKFDVVSL